MSELLFPRTVGSVGSDLNGRVNPDFDGIEYAGWGTGSLNGKVKWINNPLISGKIVTRWQINYGDLAVDQYGPDGQRIEMWKEDSAQNEGDEYWFAFEWILPDGSAKFNGDLFRVPSSWALMFQHHGISESGSPVYALEIKSDGWNSVTRTSVGFA